jgi:hypothetical protein
MKIRTATRISIDSPNSFYPLYTIAVDDSDLSSFTARHLASFKTVELIAIESMLAINPRATFALIERQDYTLILPEFGRRTLKGTHEAE